VLSVKIIAILLILASPEDQGRAKADRGAEAFSAGRYDEAIRESSEAYALFPNVKVLFNLARAYDRSGRKREALQTYRLFEQKLEGASPEDLAVLGDRITGARNRAQQLEVEVGNLAATTPPDLVNSKEISGDGSVVHAGSRPSPAPPVTAPAPAPAAKTPVPRLALAPSPNSVVGEKTGENQLVPGSGAAAGEVRASPSRWPRGWVVAVGAAAVTAAVVAGVFWYRHGCRGDLKCF
jgi:hypothetical protein